MRSIVLMLFFLSSLQLAADDWTTSEIKVTASLTSHQVPLNRAVKFIIQVEWTGDLNRYEISEVENPELRNLKIESTSSGDRREVVGGQPKAVKTFEFTLLPEELGMAYIDGIIIKYIDKATGEGKHLITNRLEVKVIDRIPEPGTFPFVYKLLVIGLVLIAIATALFFWLRNREKSRLAKIEAAVVIPLEKTFLDQLKDTVSLDASVANIKPGFSQLSFLFRKYLSEKFTISTANAVKEEIISQLKQNAVSERLITDTDEILTTCDIMKFSGGEGNKAEFERVYTLVENILMSQMKNFT